MTSRPTRGPIPFKLSPREPFCTDRSVPIDPRSENPPLAAKRWPWLLLLPLALSCAGADEGDPVLQSLDPAAAPNFEATAASLHGARLYNSASASLNAEPSVVTRDWRIAFGDPPVAAHNVRWVSPRRIDLTIPAGLTIGSHVVTLRSPAGSRFTLPAPLVIYGADAGTGGSAGAGASAGAGGTAGASGGAGADGGTDAANTDSGLGGSGGVDASSDAGLGGGGGGGGTTGGTGGSGGTGGATGGSGGTGGTGGSVVKLLSDPFQDKTAFAFVVGYQGSAWLGPSRAGTGAVRFNPDGSAPTSVAFSFAADVTGDKHANKSAAPYPALGAAGCQKDTSQCGPDNEDGRGLFASGQVGGTPWLLAAGANSGGNLDYVYMTASSGPTLAFSYVDLQKLLGGATKGTSAMHVFNDRVYIGFPDTGGSRPYMLALTKTPSPPGLDAVAGSDAIDLTPDKLAGVQTKGSASIDAITDFAGKLYFANAGAWFRSTNSAPSSAQDNPSHWTPTTPALAEYTALASHLSTKPSELEPKDRAVVGFATLGGRLYAARNTTLGPQLWSCTPAKAGSSTDCDPQDWALIAANASGDKRLSQFNNPSNTSLSMLVVAQGSLFVGYDNATQGLVVFRSSSSTPSAIADFTGADGCSAGAPPSVCESVGKNGFGSSGRSRIFDAKSIQFGASQTVYVVAGDGIGPLDVFRIVP